MDITKEVQALEQLKVSELRERYAEVFGESTRSNNKVWLIKKIAWKLQANEEGGLSERAQKHAAELAKDSDVRVTPPREKKAKDASTEVQASISKSEQNERYTKPQRDPRLPKVGSTLFRPYKGATLEVKVLEDGFEYEGEKYKSLSSLAVKITGTHCSGFHFFKAALEGARNHGE